MQNPRKRATFATLVVPVALLAGTLSATGLPETAALEEVQLTVVGEGTRSSGQDLVSQSREVTFPSMAGEASWTFDILREDFYPKGQSFHLPQLKKSDDDTAAALRSISSSHSDYTTTLFMH